MHNNKFSLKKVEVAIVIYLIIMILLSIFLITGLIVSDYSQYDIYFSSIHAILLTIISWYIYNNYNESNNFKYYMILLYFIPIIILIISYTNLIIFTLSFIVLLVFNFKYCILNTKRNNLFKFINILLAIPSVLISLFFIFMVMSSLINDNNTMIVKSIDSVNGTYTLIIEDKNVNETSLEGKDYEYYVEYNDKSFFFLLGNFSRTVEISPSCDHDESCFYENSEWINDNTLVVFDDEYIFE